MRKIVDSTATVLIWIVSVLVFNGMTHRGMAYVIGNLEEMEWHWSLRLLKIILVGFLVFGISPSFTDEYESYAKRMRKK